MMITQDSMIFVRKFGQGHQFYIVSVLITRRFLVRRFLVEANFNRKPKNYGSDQSIKMSLPLPEWQVEYKWLRILDWLSLFIINVNVYMNIITKHITAKYKNYFQFLDEHISRKVFFMILYLRYRSWNIEIFNLRRFHYLGPSNHKFKTDSFSRNNGDTVKRFD